MYHKEDSHPTHFSPSTLHFLGVLGLDIQFSFCPKNFDFQVREYPPPHTKKIFFANLHDLGHKRKKKCENDPILFRGCSQIT